MDSCKIAAPNKAPICNGGIITPAIPLVAKNATIPIIPIDTTNFNKAFLERGEDP